MELSVSGGTHHKVGKDNQYHTCRKTDYLHMQWKLINQATRLLDDGLPTRTFDFMEEKLSGKRANQPRWKRAVKY